MIPISISALFVLPVVLSLAAISSCWLYYAVKRSAQRERHHNEKIYRCSACEMLYVDKRDVPLSPCTRCGTLNEAVRF